MTEELRLKHHRILSYVYCGINFSDGRIACIICDGSLNCACVANGYGAWLDSLTRLQIFQICAKVGILVLR